VHALVDLVPLWDHGVARWSDSAYVRLRAALVGRTARSRAAVAGSRLPCRIDALTLLVDIDQSVAAWEPDGKGGTVERLRTLTARGFRPQDCGLIDDYCGQIERWVIGAAELLGDRQVAVALRLPCPSCGARFVYRRSGSESVRAWALQVTESGCECLGFRNPPRPLAKHRSSQPYSQSSGSPDGSRTISITPSPVDSPQV
jgi:hypothetical protein